MTLPTERLIICGTDFSENAADAVAVAAALAQKYHTSLRLLHVADQFNVHGDNKEELNRHLRPARERLKKEIAQCSAIVEQVGGAVLHGQFAEDALVDFSAKHPVDLLVVSAVSKTAFDHWSLGSVSEEVAETAPVPTLTVRSAKPFEAWVSGERALKIFVAADFTTRSDAALRWVGELRNLGPCEVTVFYVASLSEEEKRLGIYEKQELGDNDPAIQAILEADLREKATLILGAEPFQVVVRAGAGKVDFQIVGLAIKDQADLLVVGTHQRQGFHQLVHRSVSRGILRHAPMSVVCVPRSSHAVSTVRPCRRVLVAMDLKEHGTRALEYAYSVVDQGGTVCLAHVCRPAESRVGGKPHASNKNSSRISDYTEQLQTQIPAEAADRAIKSEIRVIENPNVIEAICQAAEAFNADIVCIGAHTRPGAAARIMGSVTLGVLQKCYRPVLVVWPARD
jgi:nucleotide-binding universal stress UspA family protein